jgi:RHS repeat-associated protein
VDGRGRFTQETLGNRVVVNHNFDSVTGLPGSITAGVGSGAALQNNSYLFDEVGNLIQRQDNNGTVVTENVFPDTLNRLDHTVGDSNTQLTYDAMGRLWTWQAPSPPANVNDYSTSQSGCSYYANSQPHAVRSKTQGTGVASYCYDANGNMTQSTWRGSTVMSSTWTSYNKPNLMTGGWPSISTGTSTSQFFYDHNHQRWKQVASYSGSPETTEYIGGLLEKMQNATETVYRYYAPAGNNTIVYNRSSTGTNTLDYLTSDHLGSTAVITDPTGALVVKEKFAALGWNENTSTEQAAMAGVTRHEFTGQEGIDNAGLWAVNMNGRVYEPAGAMFLSPDPYISDPTDTRSYNRYAYVNYNPLTYTDPSGYLTCVGGGDATFSFGDTITFDDNGVGTVTGDFQSIQFPNYCLPDIPNVVPFPDGVPSLFARRTAPNPNLTKPQGNQQIPCAQGVACMDPCLGAGNAPSPSQFAAQGQALQRAVATALQLAGMPGTSKSFPYATALAIELAGLVDFRRGSALDAQAYGSSVAYGNYTYGVFLAANGWSINETLTGANAYGYFRSSYNPNLLDPTSDYPSIPPANVANITVGFNAQLDGSTCTQH